MIRITEDRQSSPKGSHSSLVTFPLLSFSKLRREIGDERNETNKRFKK